MIGKAYRRELHFVLVRVTICYQLTEKFQPFIGTFAPLTLFILLPRTLCYIENTKDTVKCVKGGRAKRTVGSERKGRNFSSRTNVNLQMTWSDSLSIKFNALDEILL